MTDQPQDDISTPTEEGFATPGDLITEPCLTYMARIMELREFVGFYFNFVETSATLKRLVPERALKHATGGELRSLSYDYSKQRPLVNQIMLSRAVESFDLYLTTILRDIFLSRPEMLKSKGTIEVGEVIDAGGYDELIWRIVDRKVHDLSYKSLRDLRDFITSRTGIDLFPDEASFHTVMVASEVRNLIAHNDCFLNEVFLSKLKGIELPLELSGTNRVRIDDQWLRSASYTMDRVVFRFDESSSQKFGLRTLHRMGAFILRD